MRGDNRGPTFATTLLAVALCGACSPPLDGGFLFTDGSADDAIGRDAGADSATSTEDGDAPDTTTFEPDSSSAATDSSAPDTGTLVDAVAADTSPTVDTGVDSATFDAASCTVGPGADYQASCTSCTITSSCLLTCVSCTTMAQTQNDNPTVQLPCPGTTSVQNDDGVLACQ